MLGKIGTLLRSIPMLQRAIIGISVGLMLSMALTIWLKSNQIERLQQNANEDALAIEQFKLGQQTNLSTIAEQAQQLGRLRAAAVIRQQSQARALAAMRSEIERQATDNDRLQDELQTSITDDMRACVVPADTWRVLKQTAAHSGGDRDG